MWMSTDASGWYFGTWWGMSNWREQILSEFTPTVARLTPVADPDRFVF